MLDSALTFLRDEINAYINLKTSPDTDRLVLNHLVGENGEYSIDDLGMTLVNLEEDRTSQPLPRIQENAAGGFDRRMPEVKMNLYVLFAANWSGTTNNYNEALKHIGFVVTFFQSRNLFSPANSPSLPDGIEKLSAELVSLSFEQQNNLWGALGAKYLPSVLYRLRVLYLEDTIAPLTGERVRIFKRDYKDINN